MKISTGAQTAFSVTAAPQDALAGCFLKIYSGTVPADADAAIGSAVLLDTYSAGAGGAGGTGGTFSATMVSGAIVKTAAETWGSAATGAVASGTASFARLVLAGDDGTSSTSQVRLQFTVGTVGTDFLVGNTTFTAGAVRTLGSMALTLPKG